MWRMLLWSVCIHEAEQELLPPSIMVTRDDVCDTTGEEGSGRKQGGGSLIIGR